MNSSFLRRQESRFGKKEKRYVTTGYKIENTFIANPDSCLRRNDDNFHRYYVIQIILRCKSFEITIKTY
jgi:hypothetical protein